MDNRVKALSEVLARYSLRIDPDAWVVIQTEIAGAELALACVESVLEAGGNPTIQFYSDDAREITASLASERQLQFVSPVTEATFERADALITINAPTNTQALARADPARLALQQRARLPLTDVYMRRFVNDEQRLVITEYPTQSGAQNARMSLREYQNFVYGAGLLAQDNPVAAWREFGDRLRRLGEWLSDRSEIHVVAPGTDLRLNVEGRVWVTDDGHLNLPGGEVFTGPREDSVEGHVTFNLGAFYLGNEVNGARLEYRGGRIVDAGATSNEPFLLEILDTDEGARRLGEFAFGANPNVTRVTHNTLFDEKMGGTIHMAIGGSIPHTGGENTSAVHWDMVLDLRDGGRVTADGEPVSVDGNLQF